MREDFPTQVCVHSHEIPDPPKGQRLPLFILVTKRMNVVILEGMPDYPELREILSALIAGRPVSSARTPHHDPVDHPW